MHIHEETYHWNSPLKTRGATRAVILHHAAADGASAQDIHRQHQNNGWSGIGYHYYVRKTGEVFRGRPEHAVGTHAAGRNGDTIGVCFEGNFQHDTMPPAQFAAGAALLANILTRCPGLPLLRHRDVCQTACPGQHFPFEALKEEAEMTQERFNEMAGRWLESLGKLLPSDWSAEARSWAEAAGLIQGDGAGNYQYKRPLTREEYVAMEYRRQEGRA